MTTTEPRPEDTNVVRFKDWFTAQEAADYLGVARDYIYRLKAIWDEGGAGVPGFRLGDSGQVLMFRLDDLDTYKRQHPNLGRSRRGPDDESEDDEAEDDTAATA